MARLTVSVLGPFEVTLDGHPVTTFKSNKVRALLAYLALEPERPRRRDSLATLLWPDWSDRAARRNLRHSLANLRSAIGDRQAVPPFLSIARETIQFNRDSDYWLDVQAFHALLEADRQGGAGASHLEDAVALYRGPFLEGFFVKGCPAFEDWALLVRERLHRQVLAAFHGLAAYCQRRGDHERACLWARRQLELEPWQEEAHRQLMLLLALSGQRSAALAQFEACCRLLADELGVQPAKETTALYEQIRDQTLQVPVPSMTVPHLAIEAPPFLADMEQVEVQRPLFVTREPELARLSASLDLALAGQGRVALVRGEAGSGKTALLQEFTRRAQDAQPDLLVAAGSGSAHTRMGDSYLPFREILRMLSGDVEAGWAAGAIGAEHARRLWHALPLAVQALVEQGPGLVATFVPSSTLVERLVAYGPSEADWLARLEELANAKATEIAPSQQSKLFQQYSQVLHTLARQRPLLLILDDLQWADGGSINLLFHLARRLAGHRILIIGAYRPEEVESGWRGERHPLQPLMNELQRSFGDITVDLDRAEGRGFIEAMLDSEPNLLGSAFREMLYQQTRGHALFTVELLRGMQARGDIFQDQAGRWVEGASLDWQTLPSRVEAVIAERVGRLPAALQQTLRVAGVEGEVFTAEVLARAQRADEQQVVRQLSGELSKRHRLVFAASLQRLGSRRLSRYRFGHILFQKYLYSTLDPVERGHLHETIGNVLEGLYRERVAAGEALQFGAQFPAVSEGAVQLTRHFEAAGMLEKAAQYRIHAGIRAYLLSANDEAIVHFEHGLALLERLPHSAARDAQELTLLLAYLHPLRADRPFADPEVERMYARVRDLGDEMEDVPLPLLNGMLWTLWVYHSCRAELETALQLAKRIMDLAPRAGDPLFVATAHLALGEVLTAMAEHASARDHLEHTVEFFDRQPQRPKWFIDQRNLESALSCQSWVLWFLGYPDQALRSSQEALAVAQELDHPFALEFAFSVGGAALHLLRRELEAAQQRVDSLVRLGTDKGFALYETMGALYRGRLQVESGRAREGIQGMREALEAIRATGIVGGRSQQVACLVAAYLKAGQVERGLSAADDALAFVEETSERWFEPELHRLKGELLRMDGYEADAEASFRRAVEVARQQQAKSWELRATMSLCRLLQARGKREEAQQLLTDVYGWFTEGFDTPDLQQAKALLEETARPDASPPPRRR
jgi:DNA-binding SARP family transcriptional activator/predicted negative regulator of RcsB-dependent stress response